MKRLLIAMLALLTGLAVQAAPATARAGDLSIGAEAGAVAGVRTAKAAREVQVVAGRRQPDRPAIAALEQPFPYGETGFAALTVLIGADRARE